MLSKFFLFLRHAIALVRADKLFSAIYIAGTAVAIASAMVVVIVLNIKLADIKPEVNRSRTLYLNLIYRGKQVPTVYTNFSTVAIDSCFRKMKCVELATGQLAYKIREYATVGSGEKRIYDNLTACLCDHDFFRLYDFTFVEGRPFSEKEFRNGDHVCVITENVAKKLPYKEYNGNLYIDGSFCHVVGVIKPACSLMSNAAADIYYPYKIRDEGNVDYDRNPELSMVNYAGSLDVKVLLREGYTRQDFLDEIEPIWNHYYSQISSQVEEEIGLKLSVRKHIMEQFFLGDDTPEEVFKAVLFIPTILLILIFLFLPAINLSGLVSNRMEDRLPEMGIRKAFGAKRRTLLREVINENLVLTLCGGALGWALSWLFINTFRNNNVFMEVLFKQPLSIYDAGMEFAMFFTPKLFLICFICCAVLNLMAALIPAWRSLRKPIVESLNQKR